jgi:hypothetical protein
MLIQLTDSDLAKMPTTLCENFLEWLQSMNSLSSFTQTTGDQQAAITTLNDVVKLEQPGCSELERNFCIDNEGDRFHVRLSELFDAGLTRSGMPLRVRFKRRNAKDTGRDYLNNLAISPRGTVVYNGEEFDKPSPLATKLNGSPVNGWEYVEVKKDGEWVRLDELRQRIRQAN